MNEQCLIERGLACLNLDVLRRPRHFACAFTNSSVTRKDMHRWERCWRCRLCQSFQSLTKLIRWVRILGFAGRAHCLVTDSSIVPGSRTHCKRESTQLRMCFGPNYCVGSLRAQWRRTTPSLHNIIYNFGKPHASRDSSFTIY